MSMDTHKCDECGEEIDPTIDIRRNVIDTALDGLGLLDATFLLASQLGYMTGCMPLEQRKKYRKMVLEMMDEEAKHAVVANCDA